jgi:hypothetical protein
MGYGFSVISDAGVYQVDGEYSNYSVTSTGTGTFATDNSFAQPIVSCSITVTGSAPLIAFSGTTRMSLMAVSNSGSSWTFYLTSKTAAAGSTFSYWIFDAAVNAIPSGTQGIEVFNDSGVRVFHSHIQYLRVSGIGGGTYSASRVYAVIQLTLGMSYNETDISGTGSLYRINLSYSGASVAANVIATGTNIYENYTTTSITGASYSNSTAGLYLVVDVTNY